MREFILIVAAAIASSLMGAGFGWLIGRYAPETLAILFPFKEILTPVPVAAALGAISGLGLGAAAMAAGLFVAALRSRIASAN